MRAVRLSKFVVLALVTVGLLMMSSVGAYAATYYVSPGGDNSNSGSSSAPFKTIQKAADIVNPGDTVIVRNGVYTDTNGDGSIVKITRSGTSANWITFRSENQWGAVLDGRNDNSTAYGFRLKDANYIRIEDFEIKGCEAIGTGAGSSSGINILGTSHHVYIYRNYIHDIGRRKKAPGIGQAGAGCAEGTGYVTIDSNVFHTIGRLNPDTTPSATEASCTDGTRNTCYNHDHALYMYGHDNTIINNIFYDHKSGWAIQLSGGAAATDGPNWTIINNTFAGQNTRQNGHIIIWSRGNKPTNVLIQNNISYDARNSFIYIYNLSGSSSWNFRNNISYPQALVTTTNTASYNVSGNMVQNPMMVAPENRDFHLRSGSPAIDKGIDIPGYDYDAEGNPIVGAPDIGAFEYSNGTTPPPPPPAPGDTTPPTMPAGLTATAVSSAQINLTWTASTDNVGVAGYKVYRNANLVATVTARSFSDTGLSPSTTYTYRISAFDTSGNTSSQSGQVSATTMAGGAPGTEEVTVYATVADGQIWNEMIGGTWSSIRGAATGLGVNTSDTVMHMIADYLYYYEGGAYTSVFRGFLSFDTSSIPTGATINAVSLSVYVANTGGGGQTLVAQQGTQGSALGTADFDNFSGSSYGTVAANELGYKTINFNTTGVVGINKDGITNIVLREYDHDYQNISPNSGVRHLVGIYSANAGTTYAPKLVINYTP